jgi:hypothetical protein
VGACVNGNSLEGSRCKFACCEPTNGRQIRGKIRAPTDTPPIREKRFGRQFLGRGGPPGDVIVVNDRALEFGAPNASIPALRFIRAISPAQLL